MRTVHLLTALVACAGADAAPPAPPAAGPRMMILELMHDAGRVEHGTALHQIFVFGNTGTADLKLTAKPGSGCTATVSDATLSPGGVGRIVVDCDAGSERGPITKTVQINTNDPAMQVFQLGLSAEIVFPIDVTPTDKVVMVGRADQIQPAQLTVAARDGKPFDVTRLDVDKRLTASVVPAGSAGVADRPRSARPKSARGPVASGSDRYLLTIAPKADVPLGRAFAEVTVSTSDARVPRIPIQVILGVQGPVEVSSDRVSFAPGAAVQHVTVLRPDGGKLTVLGVQASTADVKATVTPVRADHEYDVTIRYVGKPGQTIKSTVTVRTNEPRQRSIVIQVAGRS